MYVLSLFILYTTFESKNYVHMYIMHFHILQLNQKLCTYIDYAFVYITFESKIMYVRRLCMCVYYIQIKN